MTEQRITYIFKELGLGEVIPPITSVSGGLMHRMYRVNTAEKSYAVKHLNPEIMKRPATAANFARAEKLEGIIEDAGIPIVPALRFGGRKMQCIDGAFFYIFDWHEGSITDWNHILADQCRNAGSILGRIHALEPEEGVTEEAEESHIDWDRYVREAFRKDPEIGRLLSDHAALLHHAEEELNRARKLLPPVRCISDGDMDPKNVMWENGKPFVIDLECLDYGNPAAHALDLSLQWSGITTCNLDLSHLKAFFEGYLSMYDNGFRGYNDIFGIAYTWIEWLEYNVRRALGESSDEDEQLTGVTELKNTLHRIRYIHEMEQDIREALPV